MPAANHSAPHLTLLARVIRQPETFQTADLNAVLDAGLGGAMRARLPQPHPLRESLRQQALDLALRHAHIRAEVRPLLAAWAAAGIPALLFKGFALAEFEYDMPGERFYGDVDVLLPEDLDTVMRAAHIAIAHGWRSDGQHADPATWTHETMHLYSPGGNVRLDVHRWVVAQSTAAGVARLRDLTAGYWARAVRLDWQGVPVWRPDPLDAAVLNIALGRSWGGDSGGLKPADYLDMAVLQKRYSLSEGQLQQHAQMLGGAATWAAFRQVCDPAHDPAQQRLNLDFTHTGPLIHIALKRDGLSVRRGRLQGRMTTLRRVLPLLPAALLDVGAAWWAVRCGGDPRQHLARWTPGGLTYRATLYDVQNRILAASWWTRLLYPRQRKRGVCVPRAYATYRALRRLGHPAVFVSGVASVGGVVAGHAWIEDDWGSLELYGEANNRRTFKVVFSYPESPERPLVQSRG